VQTLETYINEKLHLTSIKMDDIMEYLTRWTEEVYSKNNLKGADALRDYSNKHVSDFANEFNIPDKTMEIFLKKGSNGKSEFDKCMDDIIRLNL